jgi:hypothetical protein
MAVFKVFVNGVVIGAAIAIALAPVLQIVVGYAALQSCAGVFVQKRDISDLLATDFAHHLQLKLVAFSVDPAAKSLTASILGGWLASQVAESVPRIALVSGNLIGCSRYRPSTGCSLGSSPEVVPMLFSSDHPPARCTSATSARMQVALENHAARYPNSNTLAVAVMRASTLEVSKPSELSCIAFTFRQVLGSLKGSFSWAHRDTAMLHGWSVTKSILNALIGIRVRQGKLSLHQKALFPEWCEQPSDERCGVSVLELLQMTSGLHFDETYGAFSEATHMLFANTDIAMYAISRGYDAGWFYLCAQSLEISASCSRQKVSLFFCNDKHFDRRAAKLL